MRKISKGFTLLFFLVFTLLTVVPFVYAAVDLNAEDVSNSTPADQLVQTHNVKVCANKGDWHSAPENSMKAIQAAAADYVSVDVQLTKDKVPVLMEDETVDRMCVDANGKAVHGKVSSYDLEKLRTFRLRMADGTEQITEEQIPKLEEVLFVVTNKIIIADMDESMLDAVLPIANAENVRQHVMLRIDGDTDRIIDRLAKEKGGVPNIILRYDGNIIFSVNGLIKKAARAGLNTIQLGTKNHHGVIFYDSVRSRAEARDLTMVFSMTDGYNARRDDNIIGWDDVISHGFSIIETNEPAMLAEYAGRCDAMRGKVDGLLNQTEDFAKDGTYPKDLQYEYNKARSSAKALSESVASETQLAAAYTRLDKAYNALQGAKGESTSASVFRFTPGRIITAVICLAAVVAAQVFFFQRRKAKKETVSEENG